MITTVAKRYSRGNDDPAENQYQTALIEVNLTVNTNDCEDTERRCKGTVVNMLSWKATASTSEPMFAAGSGYQLRDTGTVGSSANLTFTPGPLPIGPAAPGAPPPSPSPVGSTLAAQIDIGVLGCRGGTRQAVAVVEQAGGTTFQEITYRVAIDICGVIATQEVSIAEVPRPGRIPTPLIDVTPPPPGSPPGPTGYPLHPGTPRTP